MEFKDKYSTEDEKDKIKISKEAFAVGEMLQELSDKLERLRLAAIK